MYVRDEKPPIGRLIQMLDIIRQQRTGLSVSKYTFLSTRLFVKLHSHFTLDVHQAPCTKPVIVQGL